MNVNQLLVKHDGSKKNEWIIVIVITNFPKALDKTLLRPGHFDCHVVVPDNDVEGCKHIL